MLKEHWTPCNQGYRHGDIVNPKDKQPAIKQESIKNQSRANRFRN